MIKNSLTVRSVVKRTDRDNALHLEKRAKCKKQNHYAKMCHTRKKIHIVQDDPDDSDDLSETFFIKMVSCEKSYVQPQNASDTEHAVRAVKDDKWTAPLLVNGTLVTFKIDTGAKANMINENDLKALEEKPKSYRQGNVIKSIQQSANKNYG